MIRENLRRTKEIIRELYAFSNQFEYLANNTYSTIVNESEKELLEEAIVSLTNQLRILNKNIPYLIEGVESGQPENFSAHSSPTTDFSKITFTPPNQNTEVSFVISEEDKKEFLENIERSRFSIQELKRKQVIKETMKDIGKPSVYAKISNYFFKNLSNKLVLNGYFNNINRDLRKINSHFVVGSYVSMIFFTIFLFFLITIPIFVLLLFFDIGFVFPNILTPAAEPIYMRFAKYIWAVFIVPLAAGFLVYAYPSNEAKSLGGKINQELPFVTIQMSAIASSGVEPVSIFQILLKSREYKHTNIEIKKLMNLINFHGADIVSALRRISMSSSSSKLKELLNGLAVTITSGGDLHQFLGKHAENMLFDYKLERERSNKISETYMDIYISIAIAAPMILMMIFVMIGGTGMIGNVFNLSIESMNILMIIIIFFVNVFFLIFLKLKQPVM